MKKKIIFISEALWIGGIETALVNLLKRMDYEKYDVTLLLRRAVFDGDMKERVPAQCRILAFDRADRQYRFTRLYHLTEKSPNPSRLHQAMMWSVPMIKWVENRLYIRYIRKQLNKEQVDTCVIYSDVATETAVRAVRADSFLLFYHNAIMDKAYHDEIGYRKSKKIIAVSEKKAEELKSFRPKYADKYMTIHNLVDLDGMMEKSKQEPEVTFSENGFNLVTCGRLAHQKAIDWAIRAMRSLLDKGYCDLHWWIVGGGPDEEKLRQQIESAGISDHFHLLGMQNNPYPYIANADLYVQPSRYENYSVVILEAMALKKPILATIPAAEMQITSGKNGLLCAADPESIAEGIEYLYQHREEMDGYIRMLEKNSLEKANAEIMDKLYSLLNGKYEDG